MAVYFQYGEKEVEHLKRVDKRLAVVIDQIGMVKRSVIPDLFTALIHSIIGQQISTKAHQTVWERMETELGKITPAVIDNLPLEKLQQFGITFKKAAYIKSVAQKIITAEFDINSLYSMSDEEVCVRLSELDGIGIWTAEMLMIFSMQRPNILSYGDLAILRGLRMVYHHRKIDKAKFNKYWKRYTPYASVASLYLWAVACGAVEGMKDYAPKKTKP
ncbi:MAG: DNA-3-methyladenine glycosylase 2 family protein [Tannerella sp.]|jgi:DNA-3-methyladenine glycosylase II|nr:DNA-3-methyladenine glycosylase 2 family protein [Tannerella sp.]